MDALKSLLSLNGHIPVHFPKLKSKVLWKQKVQPTHGGKILWVCDYWQVKKNKSAKINSVCSVKLILNAYCLPYLNWNIRYFHTDEAFIVAASGNPGVRCPGPARLRDGRARWRVGRYSTYQNINSTPKEISLLAWYSEFRLIGIQKKGIFG